MRPIGGLRIPSLVPCDVAAAWSASSHHTRHPRSAPANCDPMTAAALSSVGQGSAQLRLQQQRQQRAATPAGRRSLRVQAAGSTFGTLFRVTTFGESHGGGVGCVIDGVPPRLRITQVQRRRRLAAGRILCCGLACGNCSLRQEAGVRGWGCMAAREPLPRLAPQPDTASDAVAL